jgi:hypothetical protein
MSDETRAGRRPPTASEVWIAAALARVDAGDVVEALEGIARLSGMILGVADLPGCVDRARLVANPRASPSGLARFD